ncbi:MAG: ABC transporter ATP-binding protein [Calothrix sp. MO_167.B42]|nr:ABC transporter ATP-binding protein [Calothrix sp. MO_167.B42]
MKYCNRKKPVKKKKLIPKAWQVLLKFSPYILQHKFLISGSLLALLVETGLRLLEPWPLKYVFDHILIPAHSNSPAETYGMSPMLLLSLLAVSIVAIASLSSITSYLSTYGISLAVVRILSEVRGNVFSRLQRLSLSFHQQFKSGDLITRVTTDISKIRHVATSTALPLIRNSAVMLGMFSVMCWLNWELALLALTVFPLFVLLNTHLLKRIRSFSRQHCNSEGVLASTTGETIGAIKVVQALSLHHQLDNIFTVQNNKSLTEAIQSLRISAALQRTVQVLMAAIMAVVLWRGAQVVQQKALTPGELLVFISYLKNSFEPLRKISNQARQIAKATASGERVIELLEYEPQVQDLPKAEIAHPFVGAVRFENVSFGYQSNQEILQHINLVAKPGQQVAVVGASGSGKSTLLSLILRLYDPVTGKIFIDGQDIREYTLDSLRQQISIVLQESILFAVSVRENIGYGKIGATDKEIEAAARLANAHDFIMQLPQGYDTILSERGGTLSGGQRQRIAIARAAIRQAPIVILDEPTAGLDNRSQRVVTEALEQLTQGRTTFLIAHNLQTVQGADLILYVENGGIVEQGTHKELMGVAGKYANLFCLTQRCRDAEKGGTYAMEA